ncbi:glycosyltransferase [Neobacillus sp. WH10]|uniref:glycosyltransferase family 2 protein n=1 Tax=Neobacillus sp. WH10 TaxID=3047873 RepID=UPI0024C107C5|nr:glycosyltransferase [Neobacillus sp. WH10]WHY78266.1 glycosyltransferase [Neobacillus sp. WH10]
MIGQNEEKSGISIIACTNKIGLIDNIFSNFENQIWEDKELIIILNNDLLNLEDSLKKAEKYKCTTVYQLPQRFSLGKCLNFGVDQAKYDYIAKFDDDDYYGPSYLSEAMSAFKRTNAHVVGKRTAFMYSLNSKQLRLLVPRNEERWVKQVRGGTIIAKKEVFSKVRFPNRSLAEDVFFLSACRKAGFKIFSTSRYNYSYIRRGDGTHTWKPKSGYLLRKSIAIRNTNDFKMFVNKNPDTDENG